MRYAREIVELAAVMFAAKGRDISGPEDARGAASISVSQAKMFFEVIAEDPGLTDFDHKGVNPRQHRAGDTCERVTDSSYPDLSKCELNLGNEPEMPDFMRGAE